MSTPGSLAGLRVLVTRSRDQASRFSEMLRARGALVVEIPTIDIRLRVDGPLADAARDLERFDDIVLTSPNAVKALALALAQAGRPADTVRARVAVVGPATADAARDVGLEPSVVPARDFVAEGLLEALVQAGVAGRAVLFPRAADARDVLVDGLREAGARVEVVVAYETVPADASRAPLLEAVEAGLDLITIASSNTIRYLDALADPAARPRLQAVPVASIGPITTATAEDLGYTVVAEATPWTLDGLVDVIEEHAPRLVRTADPLDSRSRTS